MKAEILYRDDWFVAINKPAGLLSEQNRYLTENAFDGLQQSLHPKFLGQVHRLDKLTSGVLLFALKKDALKKINALQEQKQIEKKYIAITTGSPSLPREGIMQHWLKKDPKLFLALIADREKKDYAPVELHYQWSPVRENLIFWNLFIHGGKYHQIRAQLSHAGCPIVGDEKYGSPIPDSQKIALHAASLTFLHPFTSQPVSIVAAKPEYQPWSLF